MTGRKRKAFLVYVDLDEMPGAMHSKESAQNAIRGILYDRIPHYNPTVSLAPASLQPLDVNLTGVQNTPDIQPTNVEGLNKA